MRKADTRTVKLITCSTGDFGACAFVGERHVVASECDHLSQLVLLGVEGVERSAFILANSMSFGSIEAGMSAHGSGSRGQASRE